MSYQWKVGEPCKKIRDSGSRLQPQLPIGNITWVVSILRDPWDNPDEPMEGLPIRVYGESYTPIFADDDADSWWSDGADFRPLHGTDIRKLEEKYPEYVIKTNEVEG